MTYTARTRHSDADEGASHVPRILLIAASLRYMGGQAVMAQRLIDDLGRDGVHIEFLAVDPQLPGLLRHLERIKYVRTLGRSVAYALSLLRRVPKHDVIHVFSASYASFLISPAPAMIVGRMFGKPVVLNYHSGEAEDHLQRSRSLTKWLLGLADSIVVQSSYLVTVFHRYGFRATAIPNHLDTSWLEYRERSELQPRILVARALETLYNIPCALKAFQIVKQKYPRAQMTVLGDGSQRRHLEQLATDLHLDGVRFTGRVERADIPAIYQAHDLFLNTSSIDNMPVAILEAFAAGLPIVTTNAGGIPQMITDRRNGHLVTVDDHVAVAERICELVANPDEAARLSRAGQEESRKYTREAIVPQWKELYRRAVQSGRSGVLKAELP